MIERVRGFDLPLSSLLRGLATIQGLGIFQKAYKTHKGL
jgi:hypothetical protein